MFEMNARISSPRTESDSSQCTLLETATCGSAKNFVRFFCLVRQKLCHKRVRDDARKFAAVRDFPERVLIPYENVAFAAFLGRKIEHRSGDE